MAEGAVHASSGDKYYRSFLSGNNASRDGAVSRQDPEGKDDRPKDEKRDQY